MCGCLVRPGMTWPMPTSPHYPHHASYTGLPKYQLFATSGTSKISLLSVKVNFPVSSCLHERFSPPQPYWKCTLFLLLLHFFTPLGFPITQHNCNHFVNFFVSSVIASCLLDFAPCGGRTPCQWCSSFIVFLVFKKQYLKNMKSKGWYVGVHIRKNSLNTCIFYHR